MELILVHPRASARRTLMTHAVGDLLVGQVAGNAQSRTVGMTQCVGCQIFFVRHISFFQICVLLIDQNSSAFFFHTLLQQLPPDGAHILGRAPAFARHRIGTAFPRFYPQQRQFRQLRFGQFRVTAANPRLLLTNQTYNGRAAGQFAVGVFGFHQVRDTAFCLLFFVLFILMLHLKKNQTIFRCL